MYYGDRMRKETLVRHGFRLPSALDNRPLQEAEFWARVQQGIFVSATPGDWELEQVGGVVAPALQQVERAAQVEAFHEGAPPHLVHLARALRGGRSPCR